MRSHWTTKPSMVFVFLGEERVAKYTMILCFGVPTLGNLLFWGMPSVRRGERGERGAQFHLKEVRVWIKRVELTPRCLCARSIGAVHAARHMCLNDPRDIVLTRLNQVKVLGPSPVKLILLPSGWTWLWCACTLDSCFSSNKSGALDGVITALVTHPEFLVGGLQAIKNINIAPYEPAFEIIDELAERICLDVS